MPERDTYPVEVAGLRRGLPLFEVAPGVRIAVLNILGDTESITTGAPQTLYLDEKDRDKVSGRRVVLLDDVVSTGSTLVGMRALMAKAGAIIAAEAAGFPQGDQEEWKAMPA